jgi:hypothetical protein
VTCLREVLADLRPDTQAIADFKRIFGPTATIIPAGVVSAEFRVSHVLVTAAIVLEQGSICDIEDDALREAIKTEFAELLAAHGMRHFDLSEITSGTREVSQAVSRWLFEQEHAGIRFSSKLDNRTCYALFEGRAHLELEKEEHPLKDDFPELLQVCSDYSLVLRSV